MSLSYKYTYGENTTHEYSPFNVGFGITYVLPIIVAILKSKPDDLLIIENPESPSSTKRAIQNSRTLCIWLVQMEFKL